MRGYRALRSDEKTLVMGTALGLSCLVVAMRALTLWAGISVLELGGTMVSSHGWVITAAAGMVSLVYLVRARRRT